MQQIIFMLFLGLGMMWNVSCGFHLSESQKVPQEMKTIILDSADLYGPLTRAVRNQLHLNGIIINKDKKHSDIPSLRIISSSENQDTASIFQNGKTAEYQMMLTVQAQVLFPNHNLYPFSVSVFRSFFDNPLTALSKDSEQDILRQEMQEQAAKQLVLKLLTLHIK